MASTRAADVAEVLWEIKRAGKVATLTAIARRAGFSPGAEGKAVRKTLAAVRADWPHLEWFRAIEDDGTVEANSEQVDRLKEQGIEFEDEENGYVALAIEEEMMMVWGEESADGEAVEAAAS